MVGRADGIDELINYLVARQPYLPDYKGRDARSLATEIGRNDLASLIPTPA